MLTMDTTYTWQWQDPGDGSWHFYSQREYGTESEAREFAKWGYRKASPIRIVKVTRTVVEVIEI